MTILTTHPQLDRLDRWHGGNTQLFTDADYAALEAHELLTRGDLGAHVLTKTGNALLRRHGLLRTILTGGRF